jgi:hypothetical protein
MTYTTSSSETGRNLESADLLLSQARPESDSCIVFLDQPIVVPRLASNLLLYLVRTRPASFSSLDAMDVSRAPY